MKARIIHGERGRNAPRWQGPDVGSVAGNDAAPKTLAPLTIEQLETLQQQAWDESFAIGHAEGLAAGQAETDATASQLKELLSVLAKPFEALESCVEEQVVALAMVVVRHLLRRELKSDPKHVIGVVREALGALPVAAQNVRLVLHPDDATLVRELLGSTDGDPAWRIVENPVMTRGGCKVESDTSHVDARVEARLAAILSAVAGDDRRSNDDDGTAQ